MHGTKVNNRKLERGRSMTLRNGDVLEFGDRVTRGDGMSKSCYDLNAYECTDSRELDTHDSVVVTYHRIPSEDSFALAGTPFTQSNRYCVPEASDDGELGGSHRDDLDDQDEISIISDDGYDPEEHSSAKTTPEQPKARTGSQGNPIELEMVRPAIIDLTDEEEASPQISLRRSIDAGVPEQASIFNTTHADSICHALETDFNKIFEDSVGWVKKSSHSTTATDGHGPSIHQSGLPGVINIDADDISSNISIESDQMSDGVEDFEIMDGVESLAEEQLDDEEDALDDEDLVVEDDDGDRDTDSLYDPDSYETNKEPSPELGSDTGFIGEPSSTPLKPITSFMSMSASTSPQQQPAPQQLDLKFAPLQPPFDPVRSAGASFLPPPPRPAIPYACSPTARPMQYGTWSTSTSRPLGTAWSPTGGALCVPPPPPAPGYMAPPPPPPPYRPSGISFVPPSPFRPPLAPHGTQAPPPPPPGIAPPLPPFHQQYYRQPDVPRNRTLGQTHHVTETTRPAEPLKDAQKHQEIDKTVMSLNKMIEEQTAALNKMRTLRGSPAVTKRKADMISGDNPSPNPSISLRSVEQGVEESEVVVAAPTTTAAKVVEKTSDEPSSRRRRISAEDDVSTAVAVRTPEVKEAQAAPQAGTTAGKLAKIAGSAVLGGVATFAFLLSPLCEKALEALA